MDSDSPIASRTAGQIVAAFGAGFTAMCTFKSEFEALLGGRASGRLGSYPHHRLADGDGL